MTDVTNEEDRHFNIVQRAVSYPGKGEDLGSFWLDLVQYVVVLPYSSYSFPSIRTLPLILIRFNSHLLFFRVELHETEVPKLNVTIPIF